ncbi:MAG TPA: hypothetical protein PLZ57_16455 [Pseudobdellovibrionaceae bacterium]|nr:hypothetical protein [Pseudobdellovibrionaceae bacterium]
MRKLRAEISSGERVKVIQPHREFEGIVLNVRVSTYGPKEVFVQCDRSSFSGWVTIDQILPAAFKSA